MEAKMAKVEKLKDDMFLKVSDFNPESLKLEEVTVTH